MRLALIPLLLLLLVGCLPETQPHHDPLDQALRESVRTALVETITALGGQPPSERQLDWQASLLANFARDAGPAYAAVTEGRLDAPRLQEFGQTMVERMRERQGADAQPPEILDHLLQQAPPLSEGERLLLLGSINRLVSEGHVKLSETELRFLGRPVPRPTPAAP
jgi:hypothetical protein